MIACFLFSLAPFLVCISPPPTRGLDEGAVEELCVSLIDGIRFFVGNPFLAFYIKKCAHDTTIQRVFYCNIKNKYSINQKKGKEKKKKKKKNTHVQHAEKL
jgi:hypothetical protein